MASRAPAGAQCGEVVRCGPQHAQRQAGAVRGDRREDRVHPHPGIGQPAVDARARVVQATAGGQREPLGQPPHRRLVGKPHPGPFAAPRPRSTHTTPPPPTRTSVVRGSRSNSSRGPAPTNSCRRTRSAASTSRSVVTPPVSARTAAATAAGVGRPPCGGEPRAHPVDEQRVHVRLFRCALVPVPLDPDRPRHDARPAAAVRSASRTAVAAAASGPRRRPGASPRSSCARAPAPPASPRPAAARAPSRPPPGRCRPVRDHARPARWTDTRARPRPPPRAPPPHTTARPRAPRGR